MILTLEMSKAASDNMLYVLPLLNSKKKRKKMILASKLYLEFDESIINSLTVSLQDPFLGQR